MKRTFIVLLVCCITSFTLNAQQIKLPFTIVKLMAFSNPSGYDYLTHWVYKDSCASVLVEKGVLRIITNTSTLEKSPGTPTPDSTKIVINVNVDLNYMMANKTKDNRDHELTGSLTFKDHEYPVYGAWSFSKKNTTQSNHLYLNFTISHAKEVHIPITIPQLKPWKLTDFVFEGLDVPVDIH